jgi:2-methylcitrate dehydratase PrpD
MARDLLLDVVAIIAAGSTHGDMRRLGAQVNPGAGAATYIGAGKQVTLRDAILLNGAATTVLQRQDGYAHAKGHPASQLGPLLLAIAEHHRKNATALLSAFVAGYEVAARVGRTLGGVPPWLHDIGNWATLGLAAGAAHLLTDGDPARIAVAIDGAASLGLAFDRFTTAGGATLHHLYPAMSTTHALAVAEGAAAGMTALPGSLERFYGPHFGTGFKAEGLTSGMNPAGWTLFEILNGYFKLHPSCAHLHGVNDAVDQLIAEAGLTADNFAAIDVETFGEAMEIDAHAPHNDLAARFSARATVAAAICHGRLDDPELTDLAHLAPVMARISVRHDPSLDRHTPSGRPGRVTVRFHDGRSITREVIFPRGTPDVPASADERRDKAARLLSRCYDPSTVTRIIEAFAALGDGADVADLSAVLR